MAYSNSAADEKLLADARKALSRIESREEKNRNNWLDDVRFARLGEQWPEQIRRQRDLDKRPCLTINRLPAFIKQVTNDARQNTPSIKFHPVGDGADQATAKVLDGVARNIEYTSNADVAYDNALENAVTGGFGYFRIITDYASDDTFDQDIKIEPIKNPLTVYADDPQHDSDSAEWDQCFVTELWPKEQFERRWPKAESSSIEADSHDSRNWFSDDFVRVAEWWLREDMPATLVQLSNGNVMLESDYLKPDNKAFLDALGVTVVDSRQTVTKKVTQRIITGCEILETNEWPGKYIPIVPVYGEEIIIDGERHTLSLIRFAKDAQQMLNFWRTASTELVALAPKAPWVGATGQFNTDSRKWQNANTANYAYLQYDAVDVNGTPLPAPQRQPFTGPPAGALQEAINATDDMKSIMGLYDASLGARSNETSGRAILARQKEGDISTFNFTDNLARAIRHAGRILCDLIPKVYSGPRILRTIHEDGTNQMVAVNGAQLPPDLQQKAMQEAQQENQAEAQAVGKVYSLTTGKYDVTCEVGPSYTTKREEAANQMIAFTQSVPGAGQVIGDLLAKNLDWPGADQIAERLQKMLPPQVQGQDPQVQAMQQQVQQIQQQAGAQMQQLQGVIADLQRQLQDEKQSKSIDLMKAQTDAYNAETNRLKVVQPAAAALDPQAIQALVLQTMSQVLSSPDILQQSQQQQITPEMAQQPQVQ